MTMVEMGVSRNGLPGGDADATQRTASAQHLARMRKGFGAPRGHDHRIGTETSDLVHPLHGVCLPEVDELVGAYPEDEVAFVCAGVDPDDQCSLCFGILDCSVNTSF